MKTESEILKLALVGAKVKLSNATRFYKNTRSSNDDEAIERIREALSEYDDISGLIEKCENEK